MAAGGAGAAGVGLLVVDGHEPGRAFEGDGGGEVFGEVGAVDFMAGFAGAAFFGAVDVDEVEVFLAVAEVGEVGGFGGEDELLVVAGEAESVILQVEIGVEGLGEVLLEEVGLVRGVGQVAGGAVAGFDGAVEVGAGEDGGHSGEGAAVLGHEDFIVASEADFVGAGLEVGGLLGGVGVVAAGTVAFGDGAVGVFAGGELCGDVFVAGEAGVVDGFELLFGVVGGVGAVAVGAGLRCGFVDV